MRQDVTEKKCQQKNQIQEDRSCQLWLHLNIVDNREGKNRKGVLLARSERKETRGIELNLAYSHFNYTVMKPILHSSSTLKLMRLSYEAIRTIDKKILINKTKGSYATIVRMSWKPIFPEQHKKYCRHIFLFVKNLEIYSRWVRIQ